MPSPVFLPVPADLDPQQRQSWANRQYVADCAVDFLTARAKPLDGPVVAHLQAYVRGESTLGQSIGRIVDYLSGAQAA
jgi:hypothetical protein